MANKLPLSSRGGAGMQKARTRVHSSPMGLLMLFLLALVIGLVVGCGKGDGRATPPHMGAFLRVEGEFIEMPLVKGRNSLDADALPAFEGSRPTIWLWQDGVNLNLLVIEGQSASGAIAYEATRNEEGIYILEVTEDLAPGTYCLVQGDPFLPGDLLSRWCFRVQTGTARGSQRASTDGVIPTAGVQGGFEAVLQANTHAGTLPTNDVMDTTIQIIEHRLEALVGHGYVVQRRGSDRVLISLVDSALDEKHSPERILSFVLWTGVFEVVDTGDECLQPGTTIRTTLSLQPASPSEADAFFGEIWPSLVDGSHIRNARAEYDRQASIARMVVTVNQTGSRILADVGSHNAGKHLAIVFDKEVLTTIHPPITKGEIDFPLEVSQEVAEALAATLQYGALPVEMMLVEARAVAS